MVAQDVADGELALQPDRGVDDAPRIGHGGGERLLDEDMGARFHRRTGKVGMAVGIGGDHRHVRPRPLKSLVEVIEERTGFQLVRQRHGRTVHQRHDLRVRMVVVGERMAQPHVAETGDQNLHFTAPEVMPRMSCREKMT